LKQTDKISSEYIQELENKIVDLGLKLKNKDLKLDAVKKENHQRLRKLVHNLKNPIGVVFSFAEMIADSSDKITKEKLEKYVDIIKNSSEYSLQVLNSLSNLNRLKSPEFKLYSQKINYTELLNTALNDFKNEADKKNIVIIKNFPKIPVLLSFDRERITEVIKILLNNSLRYSPNNTTIKIAVTETEHTVETEITDDGIGISENNLINVFNEFFVINTYSENKNKCIGLGLAIAKIIIEYHNGEIKAISDLGKGSSFIFSIPKV